MSELRNRTGPDDRSGASRSLIQDAGRRTWHDLSEDEQERVKRLLTPDPDDNLDDLVARCERAVQIIRGESHAVLIIRDET